MNEIKGKVLTVKGPVEPSVLGRVMMHEHLHSDLFDYEKNELVSKEKPISEERRQLLLNEAIPFLKKCNDYGCYAFVDATMPPWRAWPTFYQEASDKANMHIILCTGFYREMELNTYFVKRPEDQIWGFVRESSVEELEELCVKEITQGIYNTEVRAGAIKLGTSQPKMTKNEKKTFIAGAGAQKKTGVTITTHCTQLGAETSQLIMLEKEGVDLNRVIIGHTAGHLADKNFRKVCIEWMRQGANFLPSNLGVTENNLENYRPLVEAIHEVFDAGLGDKITFGLDWAFCSESEPFSACKFMPPPPYVHMFTNTLPGFRKLGLTPEEEETIMLKNPQRLLPVR